MPIDILTALWKHITLKELKVILQGSLTKAPKFTFIPNWYNCGKKTKGTLVALFFYPTKFGGRSEHKLNFGVNRQFGSMRRCQSPFQMAARDVLSFHFQAFAFLYLLSESLTRTLEIMVI